MKSDWLRATCALSENNSPLRRDGRFAEVDELVVQLLYGGRLWIRSRIDSRRGIR